MSIPPFRDPRDYVQGSLADISTRRARSLFESIQRVGGRIPLMTHDELIIEAPIDARDRIQSMVEAFFGHLKQDAIDALARGPDPLERLVRPVEGERCPRCHKGADPTRICGLCGALCPTCGVAVGPYWCPQCKAT